MAAETALLLGEEAQLHLTIQLYDNGYFGVAESEDFYIQLKSKRWSPHYFDVRPAISDIDTR